MAEGGGFCVVPVSVLELPQLSASDRAVWLALCSYARWDDAQNPTQGTCWPGTSAIMRRSGCSSPTVVRALKRLQEKGLLVKQNRERRQSNFYTLIIPDRYLNNEDTSKFSIEAVKTRYLNSDSEVSSQFRTNIQRTNYEQTIIPENDSLPSASPLESDPSDRSQDRPDAQDLKDKIKDRGAAGAKAAHMAKVRAAFDDFWAAYPRKIAKKPALKAFTALFPYGQPGECSRAILDAISDRLNGYLDEAERLIQRGEAQFIPYPATWLNREAFADD